MFDYTLVAESLWLTPLSCWHPMCSAQADSKPGNYCSNERRASYTRFLCSDSMFLDHHGSTCRQICLNADYYPLIGRKQGALHPG